MKKCLKCDLNYSNGIKFCTKCGEHLVKYGSKNEKYFGPKSKKPYFLIVILILGGIGYSFKNEKSSSGMEEVINDIETVAKEYIDNQSIEQDSENKSLQNDKYDYEQEEIQQLEQDNQNKSLENDKSNYEKESQSINNEIDNLQNNELNQNYEDEFTKSNGYKTFDEYDYYHNGSYEYGKGFYDDELILPDSGRKYLTIDDLRGFSKTKLAYARNEIFARYGYVFKNENYKNYFSQKSWYYPDPYFEANEQNLTEVEIFNVRFLKNLENQLSN